MQTTLLHLDADTYYYATVSAVNSAGRGAATTPTLAVTAKQAAATAPTHFKAAYTTAYPPNSRNRNSNSSSSNSSSSAVHHGGEESESRDSSSGAGFLGFLVTEARSASVKLQWRAPLDLGGAPVRETPYLCGWVGLPFIFHISSATCTRTSLHFHRSASSLHRSTSTCDQSLRTTCACTCDQSTRQTRCSTTECTAALPAVSCPTHATRAVPWGCIRTKGTGGGAAAAC
jgi:hypothetical protein